MDALMIKIITDKAATRKQISEINTDIEKQAEKIRNAATSMSALEMLRNLPPMLEDLKTNNDWLHTEQEKLAMLENYARRTAER